MRMAAKSRFQVVEIGSGNAPSSLAHVLVDRYLDDSTQRSRNEPIFRDSRPLIVADGVALPFASKSFDLAMACSVLEHTEHPVAFLEEMARVARRGMVKVPTTFAERIYFRPFHRFTFHLEGSILVIRRKSFPDVFGGLFDYLAHFDTDFTRFAEANRGLFELVYEWEGSPVYRLEDYDPLAPQFARFERPYAGRPFPFQLCVSELAERQVRSLLAKATPERQGRFWPRLWNALRGRRPPACLERGDP
jgi:hypothetical protein